MPRLSFEGLKDPQVVHHFALELQGLETCTFRKASGFENSHDVIEDREVGANGKQYVVKQAGNLKWADIVLEKGVTDSMDLYNWRQQVIDGKDARRSGSIILYNAANEAIGRFDFVRGWPSKWKASDVDTSTNAVAVETLTISHEGFTRSQ